MSLLSGGLTAASRQLGHFVSLGLTTALLLLVIAFVARSRRRRLRRARWCARNGPLLRVALAAPLILADIVRHVLLDEGVWPGCIALADGSCAWYSATMYRAGEADTVADENLTHLSTIGVLFTIVFTYSGFALLAAGTLWNIYRFVAYKKKRSLPPRLRFEVAAVGRKMLVALMVTSAILVLAALSRLPEQVLQHQASRSRYSSSVRRLMAARLW